MWSNDREVTAMTANTKFSFERYEKKFFLTPQQQEILIDYIKDYTVSDVYGKYSLCNIYYDTDDWKLIRASLEKPVYKEKLRVRSYGVPEKQGKVFVEIKKKFDGVVYKRRIDMTADKVEDYLSGKNTDCCDSQIGSEIQWFQKLYHAKPKVYIGYDRIAFAGIEDPELRITFDTNLRWRETNLDLTKGDYGQLIIPRDKVLMEVKIPGACPMWLAAILTELELYSTSFSKYGTVYRDFILKNNLKEARLSA